MACQRNRGSPSGLRLRSVPIPTPIPIPIPIPIPTPTPTHADADARRRRFSRIRLRNGCEQDRLFAKSWLTCLLGAQRRSRAGSDSLACLTRKNRAGPCAPRVTRVGAVTVHFARGACKRIRPPAHIRALEVSTSRDRETAERRRQDPTQRPRPRRSDPRCPLLDHTQPRRGESLRRREPHRTVLDCSRIEPRARAALRVAAAWGYVATPRSPKAMSSSIGSRPCSTRLGARR